MTERVVSKKPAGDRKPDGRKRNHGFNSTAARFTPHIECEIYRQRVAKQETSRRPADRTADRSVSHRTLDFDDLRSRDSLDNLSQISDLLLDDEHTVRHQPHVRVQAKRSTLLCVGKVR